MAMSTRRRASVTTSTGRLSRVIGIGFANSRCSIGAQVGDTKAMDTDTFKDELKKTFGNLQHVYEQATRIESHVSTIGKSHAQLEWNDMSSLAEEDRNALRSNRFWMFWARNWLREYTNASSSIERDDISADDLVGVYWRLGNLIAAISDGHKPIDLHPERKKVALFAHTNATETLKKLQEWSGENTKEVVVYMYEKGECFVHLVEKVEEYDPDQIFYTTHMVYPRWAGGDNDNVRLDMEKESFTEINEGHYTALPGDSDSTRIWRELGKRIVDGNVRPPRGYKQRGGK